MALAAAEIVNASAWLMLDAARHVEGVGCGNWEGGWN